MSDIVHSIDKNLMETSCGIMFTRLPDGEAVVNNEKLVTCDKCRTGVRMTDAEKIALALSALKAVESDAITNYYFTAEELDEENDSCTSDLKKETCKIVLEAIKELEK